MQLWMIFELSLFGDEAFYWLEGQYLDWSYAELPGWTAWMIRLGTALFGQHYWAVRIISYLAFISVFYAIWLINQLIKNNGFSTSVMLVLGMPILAVVAVMALPDVWLVFFVMWLTYLAIKSYETNHIKDWALLGLLVACSLNVHVRMWIWLTIAVFTFFCVFYRQLNRFKNLFCVSLPIALLGVVPVIVFNYQNDFVLFEFQFGQRHPWYFQWQNVNFLLSQLVVISPVLLLVWVTVVVSKKQYARRHPMIVWVIITAVLHWLFYVITSLFADGLRTSVHWALISYVPVLAVATAVIRNQKMVFWGMFSGGLMSLLLMAVIVTQRYYSPIADRIVDNSSGWKELSGAIETLQKKHDIKHVITDYFMTGAELKFELNTSNKIMVLPHEKNNKHGRASQLQIMGLLLSNAQKYNDPALLVVEDSALKLQQKGKYYHNLCERFNVLKHVKTINVKRAKKQFHVFLTGPSDEMKGGLCHIPPLFYVEPSQKEDGYHIEGWVVLDKIGIKSLSLINGNQQFVISIDDVENQGIARQFPEIDDPNAPKNGFSFVLLQQHIQEPFFRLEATGSNDKKYLSQIYYLP